MTTAPPTEFLQQSLAPMDRLPDELIQSVLSFLPLQELASADCVNSRFNGLVRSSTAFSAHCLEHFRFWLPKHNLQQRLKAPIAETDWRQILIERVKSENSIRDTFEDLLNSEISRRRRSDIIVIYGYDAKDFLLRQLDTLSDAEDYLSRTWWAKRLLAQIERRVALEELSKLRHSDHNLNLERALACVDLLIVSQPPESLDQVEQHFDHIATSFRHYLSSKQETGQGKTLREQALLLAVFLHEYNLLGIQPEPDTREYRRLQNSLISVALCDKHHNSLPLISAAIYCAIARRVGLDAHPINYPAHIFVVVSPTSNSKHDLDGDPIPTSVDRNDPSNPQHSMFMDPYNGSSEKAYEQLHLGLMGSQIPEDQRRACLLPSKDVLSMLSRTANNLAHVTETMEGDWTKILQEPDYGSGFIPPCALNERGQIRSVEIGEAVVTGNARLFMHVVAFLNPSRFARRMPTIVQKVFQDDFLNAQSVRDLLLPLTSAWTEERMGVEDVLYSSAIEDDRPPTPKRRADIISISQNVQQHPVFPIGTYFKHARYGYEGLILGWDSKCEHSEAWIQQMRVDALARGRAQPFYNITDWGGGDRYVAEDNIGPLGRWHDQSHAEGRVVPHRNVMRRAGEWMKRWDAELERFVSNMKDVYPED